MQSASVYGLFKLDEILFSSCAIFCAFLSLFSPEFEKNNAKNSSQIKKKINPFSVFLM